MALEEAKVVSKPMTMTVDWAYSKVLDRTRWIRFAEESRKEFRADLTLPLPKVYEIFGIIGSGKSSLLENLANHYRTVIDIFGAADNEGLAWLRSSRRNSALLLKGPSVKVSCEWDVEDADRVKLDTLGNYEAVLTCDSFYGSLHEQWWSISKLMDRFRQRKSWKVPWCLAVREANNLLYSRITLGDNQVQAKNYMITVMRQMRHFGLALVLDSLRWMGMDKDMRTLGHYRFLKAQGVDGLPDELHFLYGPDMFDPYFMMRMPIDDFVVVAQKGGVGLGKFDMAPWHKLEHEDMLDLLGIEVSCEEQVNLGDKLTNSTTNVGDFEHVKIIEERAKPSENGRPPSMEVLGKKLCRSTRTIQLHINKHNDEVTRDGECSRCRRAKCGLSKTAVS